MLHTSKYQQYHIYWQHISQCANKQGKNTRNYDRNDMQLL